MKTLLLSLVALISILLQFNTIFASILIILFFILLFLNRQLINTKEIFIFILIFLVFFSRCYYSISQNKTSLKNESKEYIVEIVDTVNINGNFLKTEGYINNEKVIINYVINSEDEINYFKNDFSGGILYVYGEIKEIKNKKNYYEFDYKKYMNNKGIFKILHINNIDKIHNNKFSNILNYIKSLRLKLSKNISKEITYNKRGYFEALIYGNREYMEKSEINKYKNLGILHLLSISGLHIASLVLIINKILKIFYIETKIIDIVIFILLPLYTIFAGLSPSVLRASFMVIIFIILKRKNISNLSSLLITFLLMTFYNPKYIFDIGFQFSFFITFCIIMSSNYINASRNKIEKLFKISLIATISSLPINLLHFYNVSYISIFTNIIFVPFFTIILFPFIIISYILYNINITLFNIFCNPVLNFIFYIMDKLEIFFDIFTKDIYIGNKGEFFIYFIFLIILLLLIFINKKLYKQTLLTFFIMTIILISFNKFYVRNVIEEININNSKLYFARNKNFTILVNTSANKQNFSYKIKNNKEIYDIINDYNSLFAYEGINYIDFLILTKSNYNNIDYANNLIAKNKIKNLIIIEQIIEEEKIKEIIELSKFKNITVQILKDKNTYIFNDIKIDNYGENFTISYLNKKFEVNKETIK